MDYEKEFIKGLKIITSAFKKSIVKTDAQVLYDEHFKNIHGTQFVLACKEVAKRDEYPKNIVNAILAEYNNLTIRYPQREIKECEKCDRGYIHYIRVYDGIQYNYVARCDCEAGKVHTKLNRFLNGIRPVDDFNYCGKVVVMVVTPDEAQGKGIWKKLCSIKDWNTDIIHEGEINEDSEIQLTSSETRALGLKVDKIISDAEEEEKLRKKMEGKSPEKAKEIAMAEMRKLGIKIRNTTEKVLREKTSVDITTKERIGVHV